MNNELSERIFTVFSILLITTMCTFAFASAEKFAPAYDKNTESEIIVAGTYNNFEALEYAFEIFQEYYPDVEMSYVKLDDYSRTIAVSLSGEESPDIFCMQSWMIGREDQKPLFDAAENLADPALNIDLSDIRPGLLYIDQDGNVPMLPIFSTTFGLLVNEDIFRKEGLEIPTTYSELISTAEKLKQSGYPSPIMGFNTKQSLFQNLLTTDINIQLRNDPEAVKKLNDLDPDAGEYMRHTLEFIKDLFDKGLIDLDYCTEIENDYQSLILRFFQGDVPMMVATGDIVSGTEKRQSLSEYFINDPFRYSLHAIPSSDEGLFFLNQLSLSFAVNKNSADLEMTNEFMRFLSSKDTLNHMAQIKRLITPTKDFSLDGVYDSLGSIDEAHTIYAQEIGILDDALIQLRTAAYAVGNGEMSIDEAIAAYGTFEK